MDSVVLRVFYDLTDLDSEISQGVLGAFPIAGKVSKASLPFVIPRFGLC